MLDVDPHNRIDSSDILKHEWMHMDASLPSVPLALRNESLHAKSTVNTMVKVLDEMLEFKAI